MVGHLLMIVGNLITYKRRIHITLGLSVEEGGCRCYYCTATEGCVDSGNSDSFNNFACIVKHHLDSWR